MFMHWRILAMEWPEGVSDDEWCVGVAWARNSYQGGQWTGLKDIAGSLVI